MSLKSEHSALLPPKTTGWRNVAVADVMGIERYFWATANQLLVRDNAGGFQ